MRTEKKSTNSRLQRCIILHSSFFQHILPLYHHIQIFNSIYIKKKLRKLQNLFWQSSFYSMWYSLSIGSFNTNKSFIRTDSSIHIFQLITTFHPSQSTKFLTLGSLLFMQIIPYTLPKALNTHFSSTEVQNIVNSFNMIITCIY